MQEKRLKTEQIESLAKRTLEQVCGYPSGRLMHRDRPDLQDDVCSFGIEVVEDCFENDRAALTITSEIYGKRYTDISKHRIEAIKKYEANLDIENELINSVSLKKTDNNAIHLLNTIREKLVKLNSGHYDVFRQYGLYVSVESLVLFDSNVKSLVCKVSEMNYPIRYSVLYLEQHFQLFVCNIENGNITRLAISREDRNIIMEGIHAYKKTESK